MRFRWASRRRLADDDQVDGDHRQDARSQVHGESAKKDYDKRKPGKCRKRIVFRDAGRGARREEREKLVDFPISKQHARRLLGNRCRRHEPSEKIGRRITNEAAYTVFAHPHLAVDYVRLGMRRKDECRKQNCGCKLM